MRSLVALLVLTIGAARPLPHPLHTTITELTEDRARGVARATIRIFADDFAKATRGNAASYLSSSFGFADGKGRVLPTRSCGVRRTADLLWICLEVDTPALTALSIRNAVLCDLFDDQVNVVQISVSGVRRTLLFTRGDRAKPLS